jgi:hypothetical protein
VNLTQTIFRHSVFAFALIPLFAVWGFWVTYFTRPSETLAPWDHLHGYGMFAWCVMLIAQSFLIRTKRRSLHRGLGKLSYLLAPYIVITTIVLAHYRLSQRGMTDEGLYILNLQVFILLQFVVSYSLAIWNRKRPDVHARFMICTALTLLDPIFARVLLVNFMSFDLITTGVAQVYTYALIDVILIILAVLDWKTERRKDVFLPMLAFFFVTQLPTFFVLNSSAWRAFAEWFAGLPFS